MAKKKQDESQKTDQTSEQKNEQKNEQKTDQKTDQKYEQKHDAIKTPSTPRLPPELEEKLKQVKEKVEKLQKILVEKFDKYIMGLAVLPPPRAGMPSMEALGQEQGDGRAPPAPVDPNKVHVLVLIDDSEPTRMAKFELRDKLLAIIDSTAAEIDKNIVPQPLLLSELWQNCYDGKHDLLQLIAMSAPVYDTGMLAAVKIAEVHKQMVLRKFEKYIVAYVLAGSLVQGKATPQSDIDVFVVIDDTDVKKMTRVELKDKLRAIIIGMGLDAADMTGIQNKINIQVYIMTDFWESIREANPVIFTFLRDGVPFYDRGIFMPWKQLLKMGKIRPSPEAIDLYMSSGDQMLDRVKFKLRDIGMEDVFYALLTPSQAAVMMYGVPPPTPKETPAVMREIFVRKEKLLTDDEVDILERTIQTRKDLEHGTKKEMSGKEVDTLLTDADKYLKRLKRLFGQIETMKEKDSVLHVYEAVLTAARDILRLEGIEKTTENELVHTFEEELISSGKVPAKYLRSLHAVLKAKENYDKNKLTKTETDDVQKQAGELIRHLTDYIARKRGKELERARIRVKYGEVFGEVAVLGTDAFVLRDIDAKKSVEKATLNPDGSMNMSTLVPATWDEFEHALATVQIPTRVFLKHALFNDLKKLFGNDVEVLMG